MLGTYPFSPQRSPAWSLAQRPRKHTPAYSEYRHQAPVIRMYLNLMRSGRIPSLLTSQVPATEYDPDGPFHSTPVGQFQGEQLVALAPSERSPSRRPTRRTEIHVQGASPTSHTTAQQGSGPLLLF
ncbi:hypothetical protein LY76DRAFT_235745 [Colletotrichum caudatum]|nr:hypothetical protein LY76DRAFT_235745 [Colletotrichum caudatum]